MSRDVELDSLRNVKQNLFNCKQLAWKKQEDAWQRVEILRQTNNPRIDYLDREQRKQYEKMKDCFNRASCAYTARNRRKARLYSSQGRGCRNKLKVIVNERRYLVAQLSTAFDLHKKAVDEFHIAKDKFDAANRSYKDRLEIIKTQNRKIEHDQQAM